ncbi:MAG: phosphate--acyl-ACP acyltransferase [Bacteroidota bacterium]
MKIGLDVLGGDFAPIATIHGAIMAQKELPDTDQIVLIGNREVILSFLKEEKVDSAVFEIVNAPDMIEMDEQPTKAFLSKPNSSISVGFRLLKNNEIDCFCSAGSTGAIVVGSISSVNLVQGIIRPSLPAYLPKESGGTTILIDVGTNPDPKPDVLYQFGILGSLFAKHVYNIEQPRVALLNIGSEEKKGNLTSQIVFQLMKDSKDFYFIGNIEGRDLYTDIADVVVCDGFVGNVVLKQGEAFYEILKKKGLLDPYFERFNFENYGGAPVLGINSTVVVGHGISNDKAIYNMILLTKEVHNAKLSEKIKQALESFPK